MSEAQTGGTQEERLRRLEDLQAIGQLFIDYGEYLDSGDFDAYAKLFADDGEVLLGPVGRARGRAEIREMMSRTLAKGVGTSFHIISSPRISLDGDRATSTVMWSVASTQADGMARITMIGHHADELVRTAEGWKFQRRRGLINLPAALPTGD